MKVKSMIFSLGLTTLLGLSSLAVISNAQAGEQEKLCMEEIQGKIPWDNGSNTRWEAENVTQLCKGTSQPSEPGKCFTTVRSSHIANQIGSGTGQHLDWRSVVSLCSGTNDAGKTSTCFNNGLKTGADWRDVILACQRIL